MSTTPCCWPIPRPTPTSATSSAACRTPTTCPPGMPQRQDGALGAAGTGRRPQSGRPCGDAHRRPRRLARAHLSHRRAQQVQVQRHAPGRSARRGVPPHPRHLRHRRQPARQSSTPTDRVVMRYDYDMLGNRIHQASMEAGERWMLNDVAGKPLYAWDSRDHQFRTAYDPLRRPTDSFLREGAERRAAGGAQRLWRNPAQIPRRTTCAARSFSSSIRPASSPATHYDFKGNLLRSQRQLAQDRTRRTLDWPGAPGGRRAAGGRNLHQPHPLRRAQPPDPVDRAAQRPALAPRSMSSSRSTTRPTCSSRCTPGSTRVPSRLGWLDPGTANLHAVTNIDYDAKGQRDADRLRQRRAGPRTPTTR